MEIGTYSLLRSRQTSPGPLVRVKVNVQLPWVVTYDTQVVTGTSLPAAWLNFSVGLLPYGPRFISVVICGTTADIRI